MKRFRLDLCYDGTTFAGWQKQKDKTRTIQHEVEQALASLVKQPICLVGAGRTDAGVHARGQTSHFDVKQTRMKSENFLRGLNSILPPEIRILQCTEVNQDFHARFSAIARLYHYYILPAQIPFPWEERYCYRVKEAPNIKILNTMARCLHGEIDFTAFSHSHDPSPSKYRFIYQATFFSQGDKIVFRISANAFLWRMVRSLVGTLLDMSKRGWGEKEFRQVLEAKDRRQAGPTAPAQGLFLHKVIYYESEFSF